MRVVLINTPASLYDKSTIVPTGLLMLAANLEQHGHQVRILDPAATRVPLADVIRDTCEFEPALIGIGGLVTAYRYILDLTHGLRAALPNAAQILGGQVVTNNIANCFQHAPIDFLATGYGEYPLVKTVQHLAGEMKASDVPGLSYRDGGKVITNPGNEYFRKLDDMPLPAYHLVDMEYYATANGKMRGFQNYLRRKGHEHFMPRFLSVMGTLGCTDRCSFCIHEQDFVGLKVFSNQYLLNHIKFLKENYGIRVFGIGEEMFITTLKRAVEFNNLMMEHHPDVYWYGSTRANHVTPELVTELEKGNCYRLAYGIESGSQRMLDLMKKRMTREQNAIAYTTLRQSKLARGGSMMVGNVGETNKTIKETIRFIRETRMGRGGIYFASAFPGGRTWDWAVERGLIKDTHAYLLRASETNHESFILSNLTPFPDWILRAWRDLMEWEQICQDAITRTEDGIFAAMPNKKVYYQLFRAWLRANRRQFKFPIPFLRVAVESYFAYYKISRMFFKTARDRMYEYKEDDRGALLPDNLIVGRPQRHLDEKAIEQLRSIPRKVVEITYGKAPAAAAVAASSLQSSGRITDWQAT